MAYNHGFGTKVSSVELQDDERSVATKVSA